MITSNSKLSCEDAAIHYFDILSDDTIDVVPADVLSHVDNCRHCQNEIARLDNELHETNKNQALQIITTGLEIQSTYAGMEIGCDQVRPFLLGMADPMLETSALTPITAHLDNCKQCTDDIETIRKFNLTNTQICQLGQMFAEKAHGQSDLCVETAKVVPAMTRMDFADVSAEILKHVSLCRSCRKLLTDKWHEELRSMREDLIQQQGPKGQISDRDMISLAVPYLSANRQINGLAALHVSKCPDCFERMLNLHNTIFDIYSRPQSGTFTRMIINPQPQDSTGKLPETTENPVRVEVTHKTSVMDSSAKKSVRIRVLPLIKPAVAAMLVIAMALFFTKSSVASVDIAQIYKELAKAVNVHIKRFSPNKADPVQEQWISRTLNIIIYKTPAELVIWDIPQNSRTTRNIKTGAVETIAMPDDSKEVIKNSIEGALGLFPFQVLSDLPRDSKWQEVSDAEIKAGIPESKAYDLLWSIKDSEQSVVFKKWRVFVDPKTNLPQRVEWYSKDSEDENYILTAYASVDYLSESDIRAAAGK